MVDEHGTGIVNGVDAHLLADRLDEALVPHSRLRKKVRCTRLQRVDGDELVALGREHDHGRAVFAPAQPLQQVEALLPRDRMPEKDDV